MALTREQERGLKLAKEWWTHERYERPFVIAGIAGSGKTYTSTKIFEYLGIEEDRIGFMAYTGMAASVLVRKGIKATTIHKVIYDTFMDSSTGKFVFELKEKLDRDLKLLVIDEVSMVPGEMLAAIQEFGIPVLVLGDHAQLKPVFSTNTNNLLDHPDIFLDQPMRQSLDNPILQLADDIRNGRPINYGRFGDNVNIIKSSDIDLNIYKDVDQVLMSYNKTVDNFNQFYRQQVMGIDTNENKLPTVGEKIICLKNNWHKEIKEDGVTQSLTNGLIGTLETQSIRRKAIKGTGFNFKPAYFEKEIFKKIYYDDYIFDGTIKNQEELFKLRYTDNEINKVFKKRYISEKNDINMRVIPFNFAYGITIHKSQGSEFDNVVVFSENFSKDRKESLYTAVTRAKKNLTIVEG